MYLLEMVYIKPPVCEDSDNIQLCVTASRDLFVLRKELQTAIKRQTQITNRIKNLKGWNVSKIKQLWHRFKKLSTIQQNIIQLEDAIQNYMVIRGDVDYSSLLKILNKGEIGYMVAKELGDKNMSLEDLATLLSGKQQQGQFLLTFGKRKFINKKEIERAFAKAILDSIAEDSKKVKVQNKQFDLDIETLERNLESSRLNYKSQIENMEDQLDLFRELQQQNIAKISDEIVEELDLIKAMLGPETVKLIIQYVNLYTSFLDQINELSRETPIETNAAKLITFLSKTKILDVTSYVETEQRQVKKRIQELEKEFVAWERYKTSIQTVMFKLTSKSMDVVKDALSEVYNTIAQQKPSVDVEDVKEKAEKRKKSDRLLSQIAEAKGYAETGVITQREADDFIKIAELELMGLGYDLSGLDIFEEVARTERELQERKANIQRSEERGELQELKDEKQEIEEQANKQLYVKIGELNNINMNFDFLVKYEFAFLAMMKRVQENDPDYFAKKKPDFIDSLVSIIDIKEELAVKQFDLMIEINWLATRPTEQEKIKKDSRLPEFVKNIEKELNSIADSIEKKWDDFKETKIYKIPKDAITTLTNVMTKQYASIREIIRNVLGIKDNTQTKIILTIRQLISNLDISNSENLIMVDKVYKAAKEKIKEDPIADVNDMIKNKSSTSTLTEEIDNILKQAQQEANSNNVGFGKRVKDGHKIIRRRSKNGFKKKKTIGQSDKIRRRRSRRRHNARRKTVSRKRRRARRSVRRGNKTR